MRRTAFYLSFLLALSSSHGCGDKEPSASDSDEPDTDRDLADLSQDQPPDLPDDGTDGPEVHDSGLDPLPDENDATEEDAGSEDHDAAEDMIVEPGCLSDGDCEDDDSCTLDTCSEDGRCEHQTLDDGAECGEGLMCCDGSCVTCCVDADCGESSQCVSVFCDESGSCQVDELSGNACDDDDACTIGETCSEGACTGVSQTCSGQPCSSCTEQDWDASGGWCIVLYDMPVCMCICI